MNVRKDVNLLIIGGTDQSRSSFINMFDQMTVCATLTDAERNPGGFVIPMKFDHEDERIVEDVNEGSAHSEGISPPDEPTIYEYPTRCGTFRLINTPGICDTEGSHADQTHVEKILSCICQFDEILGILLFFENDDNTLNARTKYELCKLLNCLGKSAVNVINFIITHKGVRVDLGQAGTVIEGFLRQLAVDIPFDRSNTFFFACESLKYLVLRKRGKSCYDRCAVARMRMAYIQSADECVRLCTRSFKCPQPYSVRQYRALEMARQIWPRLRMTLLETQSSQKVLEEGITKQISNLDQILRNIAQHETNLEKSKISSLDGVMHKMEVVSGTLGLGLGLGWIAAVAALPLAPVVLPVVALPMTAVGTYYGYTKTKMSVKKEIDSRQSQQRYYEYQHETERSRKQKEEEALEGQRAMYARFTTERAKVVQLEMDFARFLHQNSVPAFCSAKVQILRDELREGGHTLSIQRREELEGELQEAEEQERVFGQVSAGDGQHRALTSEELLERISEVRDLEYYGPPMRQALDDCNLVNAAEFCTIVRAQAARGCMFDTIFRECLRT